MKIHLKIIRYSSVITNYTHPTEENNQLNLNIKKKVFKNSINKNN